jgi:uncharacterized membrane protein
MSDGIKWTFWGGIIGLILLIVASLIFKQLLTKIPTLQLDWVIGISMPVYFGVLVWGVKFFDRKNQKEIELIFSEINKKADEKEIVAKLDNLRGYIDDHKENNTHQFEMIHEFMSSIDNRLKELNSYLLTKKK